MRCGCSPIKQPISVLIVGIFGNTVFLPSILILFGLLKIPDLIPTISFLSTAVRGGFIIPASSVIRARIYLAIIYGENKQKLQIRQPRKRRHSGAAERFLSEKSRQDKLVGSAKVMDQGKDNIEHDCPATNLWMASLSKLEFPKFPGTDLNSLLYMVPKLFDWWLSSLFQKQMQLPTTFMEIPSSSIKLTIVGKCIFTWEEYGLALVKRFELSWRITWLS